MPRATAANASAATTPSGYTPVALVRGKQNQLLLKLPVNGKTPVIVLDTGSPVTCVDESKSKVFNLAPPPANSPPAQTSVIVNGVAHKTAVAPVLNFGRKRCKISPVVLIDLSALNQMLKSRHDYPNDAILGLDTMHALHAVVDCGTGRLLLPDSAQSSKLLEARLRQDGWTEIPMHVDQGHLVVRGSANRYAVDFIVDTGSPVSVLDKAFCAKHKIALNDETFSPQGNPL